METATQPDSNNFVSEKLPVTFVNAMRTLFDIMDVNKVGKVRFTDIESRWQDDPRKGLPKGVVESLRKVTPSSGWLSFDQFCLGLRVCLQKSKIQTDNPKTDANNNNIKNQGLPQRNRPASVPIPLIKSDSLSPSTLRSTNDQHNDTKRLTVKSERCTGGTSSKLPVKLTTSQISVKPVSRTVSSAVGPNMARVKPNNAMAHRAASMPHLGVKKQPYPGSDLNRPPFPAPPPFVAPPPPKKSSDIGNSCKLTHSEGNLQEVSMPPNCPPSALSKSGIMTVLQNWRLGKLKENHHVHDLTSLKSQEFKLDDAGDELIHCHTVNDAPPKPPRLDTNYVTVSDGDILDNEIQLTTAGVKRSVSKRKEPRRHTLSNGIDYNMLKRMKQFEQEKDILLQGIEAVERAKDWYAKQLNNVQDKMKYLGRIGSYMEHSTDAYQERLNFQMARIFEVNQHLSALVESTDKGFPLHMNLALRQPPLGNFNGSVTNNDNAIQRLRQQNNMLNEEVDKKSDRITQLEREKAALIRELFQARSQNRREYDDNTLM